MFAAALQEVVAVARLAQGLRGHGAHLGGGKSGEALAKARQAVPAALHGLRAEVELLVQPRALAHRFLAVFDALDVAVLEAADFKAKAVRSEIDSGEQCSVVHGGAWGASFVAAQHSIRCERQPTMRPSGVSMVCVT